MPPKSAPKVAAKKGPPAGMLAKLKHKMEQQKADEERLQREQQEDEARLLAEERLAEGQRKYEEEIRLKERERQKAEHMVANKEKKKGANNDALERMRASGFILPDADKIRKEQEEERKNAADAPVKPRPKPTPKVAAVQHADPAAEPEEEPESEDDDGERSEPTESDAEVDEDDWEAMDERDTRREARHATNIRVRVERVARKEARVVARAERAAAERAASHTLEKVSNLRSPICCVLGHVDTGKTSLLDRIRSTNVQGGEAGGITQQIGATFFPREALVAMTEELNKQYNYDLNVPGLLVIDTPGHESFTNLRSRGSSLCDIAILVVDIMHGLEQQTRESIRLLRAKKCPFIVALNKVDRLYGWSANESMDFQQSFAKQNKTVQAEFNQCWRDIHLQLSEEGLNSELYFKNDDVRKTVSIVPTSARTGEGVSDLILLEIKLVQQFMEGKVTYKDDLQCTILEVKPITGYGFTIDAILMNGELAEGDHICLCGQGGPIYTQIRSLLTPQPMRESRVKAEYVHHKTIKAAMGVKIAANELEFVVPGTPLLKYNDKDTEDKRRVGTIVMKDAASISDQLSPDGIGVSVQSSTLGALEALLSFLKDMKIPVANVAIGPIHKRHMHQVLSMKRREPRYAVVLAFDVNVSDEARDIATKNGIDIFEARIIYHLFDAFTKYIKDYEAREKERLREIAVFPCRLKIIDDCIHATDPIIIPVQVERGQIRPGTPLCAIRKSDCVVIPIGRVMTIERDGRPLANAKAGTAVAVKINSGESGVTFDRQFGADDDIVSLITRPSVDAVKKFKDELTDDDVNLLATLIKVLKVPK